MEATKPPRPTVHLTADLVKPSRSAQVRTHVRAGAGCAGVKQKVIEPSTNF